MKTHVCIPERPEIYDGFGLRLEIHDWLSENVGRPASDMTDFMYGDTQYYLRVTDSKINPMYLATGDRHQTSIYPKYLHFIFRDPKQAMLFKLRWGGL